MSDIIAIASGKGGVGKSFLASNLALSLKANGGNVLLIDGDLGGANLHNFLGYKVPPKGMYNFIREGASIDEVITKTEHGVDFIAGSSDMLGVSTLTMLEINRLKEAVENLNYSHIILDLGAGASYNTIDLFNLANKKILLMNSEPTSIENAYGFLKISMYRKIERLIGVDPKYEEISKTVRNRSMTYPYIEMIINEVAKVDISKAAEIKRFVESYKIGLVLNIVKFKKELNVFQGFETIVAKYLSIGVEKLGLIPHDDNVSKSVRTMLPFYTTYPDSNVSKCIDNVRNSVVERL